MINKEIKTGIFGVYESIVVNDGPVTIWIDSKKRSKTITQYSKKQQ